MRTLMVLFAVLVLCHKTHTTKERQRESSGTGNSPEVVTASEDIPGSLSVLNNFAFNSRSDARRSSRSDVLRSRRSDALRSHRSDARRSSRSDAFRSRRSDPHRSLMSDPPVSAFTANAPRSNTDVIPDSPDLTNASLISTSATVPRPIGPMRHGSFIGAIENGVRINKPLLRNGPGPGSLRNRLVSGSDLLNMFHNLSTVLLAHNSESKLDSVQDLRKKLDFDPASNSKEASESESGSNSDPDLKVRYNSSSGSNITLSGMSTNVASESNSSLTHPPGIPNKTKPNSGSVSDSNEEIPGRGLVQITSGWLGLTYPSNSGIASAVNPADTTKQLEQMTRTALPGDRPRDGRPFNQEDFEAALRKMLMRRRQRRRMIRIRDAKCVSGLDICVLELQKEIPVFLRRPHGIEILSKDTHCSKEEVKKVKQCCELLADTVNSRLRNNGPASSFLRVLRNLKCTRFHCDDEECEYIGCKMDNPISCLQRPLPFPPSPSSPESTGGGGGGGGGGGEGGDGGGGDGGGGPPSTQLSLTTHDPSAFRGGGHSSANTTIIVVSCLLTFLAGLGGAALVFWFCRRRKSTKGNDTAASSGMSSTAYIVGKTENESQYETLPDGKLHHPHTLSASSENEYTYIPEPPTPRLPHHHVTAQEMTSSPNYSEPGDHLIHRKLPVAPLAPRGEQGLAGTRSGDRKKMAASPAHPPSSYSLAQPLTDVRDGGGQAAEESSLPAAHGYFVLEESAAVEEKGAAPDRRQGFCSPTPKAQNQDYASLQSGILEEGESEHYTALEMGEQGCCGTAVVGGEEEDRGDEYCHDYLEVLPEYCVQKPVE